MRYLLAFWIGIKFSRAKRRNQLLSFISLSSVLGIAMGVATIIIGLSAMNGFEQELERRVLSVIPQGEFEAVDGVWSDWQSSLAQLQQHPQIVAAAPYVKLTALVEKGTQLKAVELRGVDPAVEEQVSLLYSFISEGAWAQFRSGDQQVILGKGVADKLGVKVGDFVTLLVPNLTHGEQIQAPQRQRVQISGLLSLQGQIDHSLALLPLKDAQDYARLGQSVSGISVQVDDVFAASQIVRDAGKRINQLVYLYSWQHKFGYLYRDIQLVRSIMYLVMVLVIGVASFNLVSTLIMAVKDRASDIAILRTMGANDGLIKRIFIWQGLFSGVAGSLLGSAVGISVALNLTEWIRVLEELLGIHFLSGDIYFVDFLPSQVQWQDVLLVSGTAIVLSLLATWYPARRANQLNPAQVLSGK